MVFLGFSMKEPGLDTGDPQMDPQLHAGNYRKKLLQDPPLCRRMKRKQGDGVAKALETLVQHGILEDSKKKEGAPSVRH